MAAKILILALSTVIWHVECQQIGETIYKNPLRPPYAAESSSFASSSALASSGANISPISGASIPYSLSVPFSQSSPVSLSSTTTPESVLESLSTSLFDANELVDKTFSEFSQQTKNSQLSKPSSVKLNSRPLNYSPITKRFPLFVKNNITASFPPPGKLNNPSLDTGITNKPQYLSNSPSRPISPGCNTNFESLNIQQFEKPFSSMGGSLTACTYPVSNYDVPKANFETEETPRCFCSASESVMPPFKRTFATAGTYIASPGSDIDLRFKEGPKTLSSSTASSKFQPTCTKNVFNGPWNTPISNEVPPLTNYEMESLPLRPCPTLRGLDSSSLYDTSMLEEVSKPFAPESSILPVKRFSTSRKPLKASKNFPIVEKNTKTISTSKSPAINFQPAEIDSTKNRDMSGILCNNLEKKRNWNKTPNFSQTGNTENESVTNSLETSISAIESDYSNTYTDFNSPNSKTMNSPQASIAGPLKDGSTKSYDINEIKKFNPVPSFIGITEIFNTGLFQTLEPSIPSSLNVAESSAAISAPTATNIPFPNSEPIYDMPQSIASASAFSEATNTINIDSTNMLTPFSYQQQTPLRFLPFDFPQNSPTATNPYSSDFTFCPEVMNPVSTYSSVPASIKPPALFTEPATETDSISLGLGLSGFKTVSGATSASSTKVIPSFPYNTITPVSSAPSSRTSLRIGEASSLANPFIRQSGAIASKSISSLGSKLDSRNSYTTNTYSSVGSKKPSIMFSSLPPTAFATFPQTSINIADTSSSVGPAISGSTALLDTSPLESAQAISNSFITNNSPIFPPVSLSSSPSINVESFLNIAESSTSSSSSVDSTSLAISDIENPVYTPTVDSQTINAAPIPTEILTPAVTLPIATGTDSTTAFSAATGSIGPFATAYSASEALTNPVFTPYTAPQTINATPTPTDILEPAVILPTTTGTDSTTAFSAATGSKGPFSTTYSASEALTNPVFTPYTAPQTMNTAPTVTENLAPALPIATETDLATSSIETTANIGPFCSYSASEASTNPVFTPYSASQTMNTAPFAAEITPPIIKGIDLTTSSITTENVGSLSNSYSASEATSELLMPAEISMPMTYSPTAEYVSPMMSSIDIPINIPGTTYPMSAFYAPDSKTAVPMKTETFPMSYVPVIQNTTPIMSSSVSTSPTPYASSNIINAATLVNDPFAPTIYPAISEYITPITSSAISKSTSSISASTATSETKVSNPILAETWPIVAETLKPLPLEDTITNSIASVSSATEIDNPMSSISTSSSIATSNTVEAPIDNSLSTVSLTSTSSVVSAAPEVTTSSSSPITNPTVSRPNLQSQKLYNLEISPVTIEVQIPSSLGSYTSSNSGYASSKGSNTISSPLMYELQIPSSMAAQLSCSLG